MISRVKSKIDNLIPKNKQEKPDTEAGSNQIKLDLQDSLLAKIKNKISSTKEKIRVLLARSRFTTVKLSKAEKENEELSEEELDKNTPVHITMTSSRDFPEEIRLQIGKLISSISTEFDIDEIAFVETFYDFYPDFYYFLLTDEPIEFSNFFPEGFVINSGDTRILYNSYETSEIDKVSAKEFHDINNKLHAIFVKQFPQRHIARIREFINKTRLPVIVLSYKNAIQDRDDKTQAENRKYS